MVKKTVGLSEEVWVPVAPTSANSLICVHHLPASLIPDQRSSKEDEARCSDSLEDISRNICSFCIAQSSELRSTHSTNLMQSMSLYIDYNLGFRQLWWYYFTCSEVWVCTGRMLISIIPIQLQKLTPVFKVLINGTGNILQETFLGYRQLHWGVVIIPKNET